MTASDLILAIDSMVMDDALVSAFQERMEKLDQTLAEKSERRAVTSDELAWACSL